MRSKTLDLFRIQQSLEIRDFTRKAYSHFLLVIECMTVEKQVVLCLNGFWAYFQSF